MKRISPIILLLLTCSVINAQNQQGIVKTRGRMVNGQVIAGTRLNGATITLNIGNPLVSGNNGAFSFNVPSDKNYSLVSARKQGYTLADPEYTRRSFRYSASNPFYVVLEDENQRQSDINAATRKVRRTLTAQLQKREDEIEELKAQNKLTETDYQKRLQQLYDNQSKSEQLVKEMAERYASTDYDQLDEFNQQVQMYIEEGELQKADSMIRSKGDMEQRVAEYYNVVAANKKEREQLKQREQKLEQSESGAAKTYEDLSQDLLRQSEIFLQKFQQDSALYCLKIRADLDTTNIKAVKEYADLCYKQKKFTESENYFQMCLRAYICNNDSLQIAVIQNSLGTVHCLANNFVNGERLYNSSLEIIEQLFKQSPDAYRENLAVAQNNLGNLYLNLHNYKTSEKYYKLALENREQLFKQNPGVYRECLATTQNNLGVLYHTIRDYENSEKYYKLALGNREQLFKRDSDTHRASLADTQNNLGALYRVLRDNEGSMKYYMLALENREKLFNENPDAYCPALAKTQNHIGILYRTMRDYVNCEKFYILSLRNYERLFKRNPNAYRTDLAGLQNNLAILYHVLHDFANGEKYYKLALENREELFKQNPKAFRKDLASLQDNIGSFYRDFKDYANSEKYYKLALVNREVLFEQNPDFYRSSLADTQNNIGAVYFFLNDYSNSIKYYRLALCNYELLYEQGKEEYRSELAMLQYNLANAFVANNNLEEALSAIDKAISLDPTESDNYDTKGEIYLKQGDEKKAFEMWKKVLELNPDFLKDKPDGTNLSNGLKKLGLL